MRSYYSSPFATGDGAPKATALAEAKAVGICGDGRMRLSGQQLLGLRFSSRACSQHRLRCHSHGHCHRRCRKRSLPARSESLREQLWQCPRPCRFAPRPAEASSGLTLRRSRGPWPALRRPSCGGCGLPRPPSAEYRARDGVPGQRPRRRS